MLSGAGLMENFSLVELISILSSYEEASEYIFSLKYTSEESMQWLENDESFEMPPERDLRDTQPTISVNYRVIKANGENELKDRNQRSQNTQYQDDWSNKDAEW